jgi:pimeloyl-ACP methyl ester carboxylesterase/uncharacterized damage-inducible protein DinB
MDIILIPGLWLDGSSWDKVVPVLEKAGHHAHPLTLPGMESVDADRSGVTLTDQVDAVVRAIDSIEPVGTGKVLVVGHSAGAGIAYAAADARPDRVARLIYVGGFPTANGGALAAGFPAENGEVPLPDWSEFDEADLGDLDEAALAGFRARAIPAPERVVKDPVRLTDERRYEIPTTVICPEFTSEALKGWIAEGMAPVQEFTKLRYLDYIDLPTGHWPQFTRPEELGRAILACVYAPLVDDQGRLEPPLAADETGTLLGFLDYQRATLAWKCSGLDAAGLCATTAASSLTLGGLLKHMALVEDSWFSRSLHGNERSAPWSDVDWNADPDWEFHSAAEDSPEQLRALWQEAVERSRARVAEALDHGGLDQLAKRSWPDGRRPNLRWILCHMIEEYARHNGHADLLRESIDGQTGE